MEGPPTPVTLYEDTTNPARSIKCYLGVSGCIGDVPFTAMVANACGHTAMKGCKYCFLVGQTRNDNQEKLGTVRFCGCDHEATSTKAHVFGLNGVWSEVPACFSAEDGSFDKQRAEALKITPELQRMRELSAIDARNTARGNNPPPPLPPGARDGNQAQMDWELGAYSCSYVGEVLTCHVRDVPDSVPCSWHARFRGTDERAGVSARYRYKRTRCI